ncbi:hypothetical protein J5N97_030106 [Dioscorea zingiberensis]|uniref:Uncharacterized protein n=1 Tax=Dioscorea zingiberensis TaxID=325984 RepID=A0A9D5BX03_9LILI|nr:hypothetical protein J5N97_030106 [Dioscorea zingiberensis]
MRATDRGPPPDATGPHAVSANRVNLQTPGRIIGVREGPALRLYCRRLHTPGKEKGATGAAEGPSKPQRPTRLK